jgi:hypothetical protein
MLTMDVFKGDAFSAISMTAAVDKVGYVPGFLGTIPGLFVPKRVRTVGVFIESRENAPALIQTSERGAPVPQRGGVRRDARSFKTSRLAQGSRIMASELLDIRAFGSETELKQLMIEVTDRQRQNKNDLDLTFENMRFGCIQGKFVDADGSVIYNWEDEFEQAIPNEIDFDLDNASPAPGAVRKKCNEVRRTMLKALKGLGGGGVRIGAICSDAFWDDLVNHPEVEKTYLNTSSAAELREGHGAAYTTFTYGGIMWTNYRGTDDGTKIAINADKARFFPIGAGIFQVAYSPGERFEHLGQVGKEFYSAIVLDEKRNSYADVEVYSYPLFVCTMPAALHRAKRT